MPVALFAISSRLILEGGEKKMTVYDKERIILEKLIEDLSQLSCDHLELMTDICTTSEEIARWKTNREKLNKVEDEFNDFLLVRSGREPIFGSLG